MKIRKDKEVYGSDINIFMLAVAHEGVAYPLMFTLLPKRGNSNTLERIALLQRYVRLFGAESIDCLLTDREFVGDKWIGGAEREPHQLSHSHQDYRLHVVLRCRRVRPP